MHPAREKMQHAIKSIVIPELRALGFKGSMPHFRRILGERADLLTFQFNMSGGSFVVELARCTPEHIAKHWRADLELRNVTAHDMNIRHRLGSSMQGSGHWFVYGKKNYELNHEQIFPDEVYERVAKDVATRLHREAESWWKSEHAQ